MERKNQTDNDIIGSSRSRFSQEERARMAAENKGRRSTSRSSDAKKSSGSSAAATTKKSSQKKGISASKSQRTNETGVSRNERVRNSSAKRKKDRKRQNNLILAMLFVIAIAIIGVLTAFVLKINTVEVSGSDRYSAEDVLTAAGLSEGDSMVLMNGNAMEEKIKIILPYIENAEIKRVWPDKVSVVLEDAVPALAIDTGNGYVLMNNSCKVLENTAAVADSRCALIKGVTVSSAEPGKTVVFTEEISTEDFIKLTTELEKNEITGISCYDLTSISSIVVIIDHRIEVRLGTLAGAAEKFRFGKKVIEETIASDKKHAMLIDITDDGKAYVRAKDDNNVNFGEVPVTEETSEQETTLPISQDEGTTAISVG